MQSDRIELIDAQSIMRFVLFMGKSKRHGLLLIATALREGHWKEVDQGQLGPDWRTIEEVLMLFVITSDLNLYAKLPEKEDVDLYSILTALARIDPR